MLVKIVQTSVSAISRLLTGVLYTASWTADDSQLELHCLPPATRNGSTTRLWWQQLEQPKAQQLFTHCCQFLMALQQQMQSNNCPHMYLLLCSLIALPPFVLLLILISWHLQQGVQAKAKQLLATAKMSKTLPVRPVKRRPAPPPPIMAAASKPPRPPKPPPRRHRMQSTLFGIQKEAVATTLQRSREQAEQYKSLRRNLRRALDGLQQPLPVTATATTTASYAMQHQPPVEGVTTELPHCKVKSAKLLRSLLKHISRPFGQIRRKVSHSISHGPKRNLFTPLWQGLRFKRYTNRYNRSDSSSSSSSSSITSTDSMDRASFFYAH